MKLLATAAALLATAAAVLGQGEDKGELQPMRIEVNVVNATTDINVGELEEATACEMPGCLFIDIELLPDDGYGMLQLLMQMSFYAYILSIGANMIGDGAEELLDLPAWAPIVGPIVLPVLGAVPDAAIVFFSGMGPQAQEQLSVGIGALAGSTVMLLTIPWVLSVYGGLVVVAPVVVGKRYFGASKNPKEAAKIAALEALPAEQKGIELSYRKKSAKKRYPHSTMMAFFTDKKNQFAVAPKADKLGKSAVVVAITLVSYVIIQFPAMQDGLYKTTVVKPVPNEETWSLVALVVTVVLFVGNLWFQYREGLSDDDTMAAIKTADRKKKLAGEIGFTEVFYDDLVALATKAQDMDAELSKVSKSWRNEHPVPPEDVSRFSPITSSKEFRGVGQSLLEMFERYDKDHSGGIDEAEMAHLLTKDMGETILAADGKLVDLGPIFQKYNAVAGGAAGAVSQEGDTSPDLTYWELVALTIDLAAKAKYFTYQQMEAEQREKYGSARAWRGSEDAKKMLPVANPFIPGDPVEDNYFIKVTKATETFRESFGRRGSIDGLGTANPVNPQPGRNSVAVSEQNAMAAEEEEEDEEDDEGEKEEEATVYFERYHQRDMVRSAFKGMIGGTTLILLFSDPMVDCLSDLGTRTGIPLFYVSFILAPMASNGSELVSSMAMAAKKDKTSITAALQQCLGACIMNNTLGLAVFLALVYFQGLQWEFAAETLCTLVPQIVIIPFAFQKVHTMATGACVFMLYPLTLGLYVFLDYGLGWN